MKNKNLFSNKTKTVKALSQEELSKILGGTSPVKSISADSIDCSSEDTSGGTTTDRDQ
jgi:hypothetical protein